MPHRAITAVSLPRWRLYCLNESTQLQTVTVAIMENGTWAPIAGRQMREIFAGMKNIELLEEGVTIRSAVKEAQEASLEALAEKIASSLQ